MFMHNIDDVTTKKSYKHVQVRAHTKISKKKHKKMVKKWHFLGVLEGSKKHEKNTFFLKKVHFFSASVILSRKISGFGNCNFCAKKRDYDELSRKTGGARKKKPVP
jgi:hypothetical protein